MTDELTLMVTGDLHLGRHPTKIPGVIDGKIFSPGSVWQDTVDAACRRAADAIVVSGDLIDQDNSFFEAWGPFESGLQRLAEADIPVFMVAGNHDSQVLEKFLNSMGDLNCRLIGRNGNWERVTIEKDGKIVLNLDGWSYPTRNVHENPLDEYEFEPSSYPTLGLLHTEYDRPGSEYAPTKAEDLKKLPVDGWLLGHIHKPELHCKDPLILNPGSPQPLNPTETGIHGPWELTVKASGGLETRQIPLATIEYVNLTVDVSKLTQPENLVILIKETLQNWQEETAVSKGKLRAYSARLTLVGETEFQRQINRLIREKKDSFRFELRGIEVFVEKIKDNTMPCLDLKDLATGDSPVGRLAELLLSLEKEGAALPDKLLEQTKSSLEKVTERHYYKPLRRSSRLDKPDSERIAEIIRQQGYLLIRELLSQKEQSL